MYVQILSGPVFGIDGLHGNLLIQQQRNKMFTRGSPGREYGRGFAAQVRNGSRHVDAAAARLKYRGTAAQFALRVNLRGQGGGIEGRGECQRVDRNHHYLLLAWVVLSLAPIGRKVM